MVSAQEVSRRLQQSLHSKPPDKTLALIFPGQGSQSPGMGKALVEQFESACAVFAAADDVLGMDLSRLCFQGPAEELTRTDNAQPAILTASIACLCAALDSGALAARPAFVAGHSLGEYSALIAAGALSFEDALLLVRERGRLMDEAGRRHPGTLAAIVGLDRDAVAGICADSGAEMCNYNGPTQIVVGGTAEAIEKACALAKERGGRGIPVNVSGAFHTSLMQTAANAFAPAVDAAAIGDAAIPVISNVRAEPMQAAAEIADDLKQQITSAVLWHPSTVAMAEQGVKTFVELGHGRILTAQLKRALPDAEAVSLDEPVILASLSSV